MGTHNPGLKASRPSGWLISQFLVAEEGRFAVQWATRWALFVGGMSARTRAVLAWVAVLPVLVVVSNWLGVPVVLAWISAGVAGVIGLFLMRGADPPFPAEEKRLAARAVLTGAGTGDPDLDGYALGVLDARKRAGRAPERIVLSVVISALLVSPILASITSSAWWLLMLPLDAAVVVGAVPYLALDIDANIKRIEAAIPPEIESS